MTKSQSIAKFDEARALVDRWHETWCGLRMNESALDDLVDDILNFALSTQPLEETLAVVLDSLKLLVILMESDIEMGKITPGDTRKNIIRAANRILGRDNSKSVGDQAS